jgi:hypothetical protein
MRRENKFLSILAYLWGGPQKPIFFCSGGETMDQMVLFQDHGFGRATAFAKFAVKKLSESSHSSCCCCYYYYFFFYFGFSAPFAALPCPC